MPDIFGGCVRVGDYHAYVASRDRILTVMRGIIVVVVVVGH